MSRLDAVGVALRYRAATEVGSVIALAIDALGVSVGFVGLHA